MQNVTKDEHQFVNIFLANINNMQILYKKIKRNNYYRKLIEIETNIDMTR